GRTENAQLAMFVHGLVVWEAVRPELDESPVAFAGHSLGQLTALVAAGVLTLEDGVALSVERAEATQSAADASPGAMAAFLGLDLDTVLAIAEEAGCWVANHNAPGQSAVAGTPDTVEQAMDGARDADAKKVVRLEVAGAFHTPMMQPAADALRPALDDLAYSDPAAPVVANHDGRAHRDGAGWADRLRRHLVEPVRWHDCSVTLGDLGAERVVEVGATRLLWPMVKRSVPGIATAGVGDPADLEQMTAVPA
ncbi:MAG: ACP S-malonyltransferase, partial [Actinomycetota bacterium]